MLLVIAADFAMAIALAFSLRALIRSRRDYIPCVGRQVEPLPLLLGLLGLVGVVVANALILKASGELGGPRHLDPALFIAWLAGMSAFAILLILVIATLHTNRTALVWIRMAPPSGLVVREPNGELEITLVQGCVRAFVVGSGVGGPGLVQFYIDDRARDRTLNLVLPGVLAAIRCAEEGPWLSSYVGPIAQGQARPLANYLSTYCRGRS
jgi:hypothetical protein